MAAVTASVLPPPAGPPALVVVVAAAIASAVVPAAGRRMVGDLEDLSECVWGGVCGGGLEREGQAVSRSACPPVFPPSRPAARARRDLDRP